MPTEPADASARKHTRFDDGALSVEEARARIMAQITPIRARERLALRAALGRVLGQDVVAPTDVPPHANSAMDGYALRSADLPAVGETALQLAGEVLAGHPFAGAVPPGTCVRIMTGGVIPEGADTVIAQERTRRADDRVVIGAGHQAGEHVRLAGEDLNRGATALAAGQRLTPADLGIIASLGYPEVAVLRRPRVAFFSTGDELRSLGRALQVGEIYDSNRYTLHGMIRRCGAIPLDMGVVEDAQGALEQALQDAAAQADAVITTGGVSVGTADHIKTVLARMGQVDFWKVNMKPGRPMAVGQLHGGTHLFGLPGNPVAAMVTFYQVVRPVLEHLAGATPAPDLFLTARTMEALPKSKGRREFQRGILEWDAQGQAKVRRTGTQGAGVLHSMSRANCFIVLPEESGSVAAGALVRVQPFAAFV